MGNVFETDNFLKNVYAKALECESLANCGQDRVASLLEEKRNALFHALALDKLYEMFPAYKEFRADMFTLQKEEKFDGYTLLRYHSETLPGLIAPFYVYKPDVQKTDAAVAFCCGHGNGAEEYTVPDDQITEEFYHRRFPIRAAKAGYPVCMSEFMAFGPMRKTEFKPQYDMGTDCYADMTFLQECGLTLLGVRVHQTFMTIAFAKTLASKTYLAGISGGGQVTTMTSALCRELVGACVMGYANSFKGSVLAMHHCICNFVPGLMGIGEEFEILGLSAPTPLLFTSGDVDEIFPVDSARECCEAVRGIYDRFGAGKAVEQVVFAGEHVVHPASVIEWLDRLTCQA